MSLEMVLMTPIFVAFLMLLAGAGRIVDAQSQVDSAARDAVRAASIARSHDGAEKLAQSGATQSLSGAGWCQGGPQTNLAPSTRWEPGGQVSVTVTCSVDLGDLTFIGLPGTKTMTATSTAPIDKYTYRGGDGGAG
jgi:Flp pilus assembly protein TadG